MNCKQYKESQNEEISPSFCDTKSNMNLIQVSKKDDKTDESKVEVKSDIDQPTKENMFDEMF